MSTISTALRNFKEPTKEQLTQIFFALPFPAQVKRSEKTSDQNAAEKMEINAVLSLGVEGEDSFVRFTVNFWPALIVYPRLGSYI